MLGHACLMVPAPLSPAGSRRQKFWRACLAVLLWWPGFALDGPLGHTAFGFRCAAGTAYARWCAPLRRPGVGARGVVAADGEIRMFHQPWLNTD